MMLYEFYGRECPHCITMMQLTDKLMQEFPGVKIERKEVWHNKKNMQLVESLDKDNACGGLPFYYDDTDPKNTLCGEVGYEELKKWVKVFNK